MHSDRECVCVCVCVYMCVNLLSWCSCNSQNVVPHTSIAVGTCTRIKEEDTVLAQYPSGVWVWVGVWVCGWVGVYMWVNLLSGCSCKLKQNVVSHTSIAVGVRIY